jgi:RNase H-fold protein (predicted Holliday junction resolvase)
MDNADKMTDKPEPKNRQNTSKFATRVDKRDLIAVKIDDKTTVYVKAGSNVNAVKAKWKKVMEKNKKVATLGYVKNKSK